MSIMAILLTVTAVTFAYLYLRGSRKPNKVAKHAPTLHQDPDDLIVWNKGKHWQSDRTELAPVHLSKKGPAAKEPETITDLFVRAIKKRGSKLALCVERPVPALDGKKVPPASPIETWKSWTYQAYYDDCRVTARAFMALGLKTHGGVNIFGFNSPEWLISAMGGMMAGGICAGIYPTDTPEQVQFKSRHSAGAIAVCETRAKAESFLSAARAGELPDLKAVVVWDPDNEFEPTEDGGVRLVHWSSLAEIAKEVNDNELQKRIEAQQPGSVAAYIYTSGTTGNPKAVMITHDNMCFEADCIGAILGVGDVAEQERILSYLPLSHVAGMAIDILLPVKACADTNCWFTVFFARPYDLKVGSFGDRLRAVQPTYFLGVPRVWEKIAEKMKALGAKTKGLKLKIAKFAKDKGLEHARNCEMGGNGEYPPFYGIAEKLVLSKVAAALGMGKLKFGFTGAAPISVETLSYFGALGIQINEVYGMSECCGATTWSLDECFVWGSCGFQLPGTEVKALKPTSDGSIVECPAAKDLNNPTEAEQGELCYRGRHIMAGYMANPDLGQAHVDEIQKKNADAIDEHGWLHSGDKGCIDSRGMVRITGRYKELIITAGGENVAPVPIEDAVKASCPSISNIMMLGDKMKFNVCLITLKAKGATGDLPGSDDLVAEALEVNSGVTTISQAMDDTAFIKTITDALVATNKNGDVCPSNASKIQKFTILPRDFSVQTGELTPTLKLKRSVTQAKHADMIKKIYASKETYVKYSA